MIPSWNDPISAPFMIDTRLSRMHHSFLSSAWPEVFCLTRLHTMTLSLALLGCSLTFPKVAWSHPPAAVPWTCSAMAPPLTNPHHEVRPFLQLFHCFSSLRHCFSLHCWRYRMLDLNLCLMLFFYRRVRVRWKFRSSSQTGNAVQPRLTQQIQVLMREVLLPLLIQHAEIQQEPPIQDHLSTGHSRFNYFYFLWKH